MVTQQEKKMLWECFGKGSGAESRSATEYQDRNVRKVPGMPASICHSTDDSRSNALPTLTKATGAK